MRMDSFIRNEIDFRTKGGGGGVTCKNPLLKVNGKNSCVQAFLPFFFPE